MGQAIEVETREIGEAAVFSTDRSITGQDGVSYASRDEAEADDRFPGRLAARLYASDEALASIFVASNQVVAGRDGGWDESSRETAEKVIAEFFLFYPAG
jgi:hypothetical protein